MPKTRPVDGLILEAVSFDAETFDEIVAYLNGPDSEWRYRFERNAQRTEVLVALTRLVREGSIEVHLPRPDGLDVESCGEGVWPDRPVEQLFFELTGRGWLLCLNSDC